MWNAEDNGYSGNTENSTEKEIKEELYALDFAVSKSVRYHSKRQRFFDILHNSSTIISAISGSSAFVAVLSDNRDLALWVSLIVAISSALDSVFSFSKKSRVHNDLRRRFSDLLKEMILSEGDEQLRRRWQAERLNIEADEPPSLTLLVDICHNEEVIARGHEEKYLLEGIDRWHWWLSDIFSFDRYHQYLVDLRRAKL
ncbi:MAG: hypothetical protein R3D71_05795 [Rickettsiales bacterium]